MKSTLMFLIIGSVLGCVLANVSDPEPCKERKPMIFGNLIGQWKNLDDRFDALVTYCADSTFHGRVTVKDEIIWEYSGKWRLIDDKLCSTYISSSLKKMPAGTVDCDSMISLGCDRLIYKSAKGKIRRYRHVGSCESTLK